MGGAISEGMTAAKLLPFLLATGGLASLHLLLKIVPAGANSGATLTVAYLVASLACLAAYPVLTPSVGIREAFATIPWHALAMGVAIACCEIGVLLAYRAGWPVGSTGVSISAARQGLPAGSWSNNFFCRARSNSRSVRREVHLIRSTGVSVLASVSASTGIGPARNEAATSSAVRSRA